MFGACESLRELSNNLDQIILDPLPFSQLLFLNLFSLLLIVGIWLIEDLWLHIWKNPSPLIKVIFAVVQLEGYMS